MKIFLETLPFVFVFAFMSSSLHAQQPTAVVIIVVVGDTTNISY